MRRANEFQKVGLVFDKAGCDKSGIPAHSIKSAVLHDLCAARQNSNHEPSGDLGSKCGFNTACSWDPEQVTLPFVMHKECDILHGPW